MKFFGKVGFWEEDVETAQDVYGPKITEKSYTGDVINDNRRFTSPDMQNKTFTLNNKISILGDFYAHEKWPSIRYVLWKDVKWEVTNVEVSHPRLILTLGGVYNENEKRS